MALVDIIILSIIAISCLIGGLRGLIKEALSLVSWVIAITIAGMFSSELADMMTGLIENASIRRVAAFAILFVATIFTGTLITKLITKLTTAVGLRGIDRILGAIFGVLRGTIIVSIIVLITAPFEVTQSLYQESMLLPYFSVLVEFFQTMLNDSQASEVVV
jgi:membrane protein required for colicin V production